MIPDWRQALKAAGEALAEDGRLHAVDFGDLTGLGPVAGGLLRRWLRLFHVEPRVEILQRWSVSRIAKATIPVRLSFCPRAMPFFGLATNAESRLFRTVMLHPRHRRAGIPGLGPSGGSVWWTSLITSSK